MKTVQQLELLEQELKMMLENISRIRQFVKDNENEKWTPYSSRVMGELKHRCIVLKQRLTIVCGISTNQLFQK